MNFISKSVLLFLVLLLVLSCQEDAKESSHEVTIDQGTNMAVALSPNKDQAVIDVLGQLWLLPIKGGDAIPLTDGLGNARQPDWSSDGSKLIFQAYWEGNWHIYLLDLPTKEITRLTDGSFDHREPAWSPDGLSIVYSSDVEGSYDLYTVDVSTGEQERKTDSPSNEYAPDWSPDGASIVYASDQPGQTGIREYKIETGEDLLIHESEHEIRGISYTPSGEGISFVTLSFQNTSLNYLNLSSEEQKVATLTDQGQDVFPFRTQWIDESNYLITSDGLLKKRNIEGGEETVIPFSATVTLNRNDYKSKERNFDQAIDLHVKGLAWPDLSPDGTSIAVISRGDLWVISPDGIKQLTDDNYLEMLPEWSPDGSRIAYISDRSGEFALYLINVNSGETDMISTLPGTIAGLAWSPDDSKIAFSSGFGPRLGRAGYVDLSTKEVINATPMLTSSLSAPTWSPEGESIWFSMLQPFSSLYREGVNGVVGYDVNGNALGGISELDTLSIGVRAKDGPVWSPDGKWMAVVTSGKLLLLPVNAEASVTGDAKVIELGPTDVPSWSADSKSLAYLLGDEIKVVDITTDVKRTIEIDMNYDRHIAQGEKVIQCGSLFTGVDDQTLKDMDIFISKNRIVDIKKRDDSNYTNDIEIIDARDQFVMPGLIDCHSHQGSWGGKKLGQAWLSWGVTSSRDPASDPYDALNRREGMESGHLISPRIFFTGSPIDGSRIYYGGATTHLDTSHIARELEKAKALDYDMIKTYVRLPDPLQKWVTKGAHEIGIPVSSHELYPGVSYGVDGVEHILGTSRRGYSPKMSHIGKSYEDVTDLIAKSGMSFTPTTGIYSSFNYLLAENPDLLEDQRLIDYSDPFLIDNAKRGITQIQEDQENWDDYFSNTIKMVYDIHRKGGHIVAGTDSPIIPYGFSLHLEMMAYNRAGLGNAEVLRSATQRAAQTIGVEKDLGTIEVGKLADILILEKDPLIDISYTMSVEKVLVNGMIYTQSSLKQL